MIRYLRLYLYFLRFSFSKAMEFRVDFWFRIVMDLIFYAVNIAFFKLIFLHTGALGGWTEPQVMIFVGVMLLIDALNMTLFSNNLWILPILINRGDVDYYLVRPVSPLFFLSLREFAANSFVNLILASGILLWAIAGSPDPVTPMQVALFLAALALGVLLHYTVHMIMIVPAFWTQSPRGFDETFYTLDKFMERPDTIYTGWVRKALLTVVPFGLMASFPARQLIHAPDAGLLLHMLIVCACFAGFLGALWFFALRSYSSASS